MFGKSKHEEEIESRLLSYQMSKDPNSETYHDRHIEWLKFQINRRDNMRIAIVSASIGALMGG